MRGRGRWSRTQPAEGEGACPAHGRPARKAERGQDQEHSLGSSRPARPNRGAVSAASAAATSFRGPYAVAAPVRPRAYGVAARPKLSTGTRQEEMAPPAVRGVHSPPLLGVLRLHFTRELPPAGKVTESMRQKCHKITIQDTW